VHEEAGGLTKCGDCRDRFRAVDSSRRLAVHRAPCAPAHAIRTLRAMNRAQLIRQSWSGWMSQSTRPVGPAWWQYLWTFVFSCGVALVFTVIGFSAFASGEGAWRN
jgi:hypothetical protein